MPSELRDKNVLSHIKSYCDEIEKTLAEIDFSRAAYDSSSVYRNALALCILQIGELVGILSDEFKKQNDNIPWRDIKQMRNIIAHKYGTFDYDVLWEVVTEDIPTLKEFLEKQI